LSSAVTSCPIASARPYWVAEEVSGDPRYFNNNLAVKQVELPFPRNQPHVVALNLCGKRFSTDVLRAGHLVSEYSVARQPADGVLGALAAARARLLFHTNLV
jgi:hypothetical protein